MSPQHTYHFLWSNWVKSGEPALVLIGEFWVEFLGESYCSFVFLRVVISLIAFSDMKAFLNFRVQCLLVGLCSLMVVQVQGNRIQLSQSL